MILAKFTERVAFVFGAAILAFPAVAEQFPSRPIKILVGFSAGGTTDAVARLYGQKMSQLLKTPVIVENKPGGQQLVAIRSLQMAPPDGYTLYAGSGSSLVQNPALRKDLPYDPLKDFSFIGMAVTNPAVIFVNRDLPVQNVSELMAYSVSHPGKLTYASAGVGSSGHLAAEAFLNTTGMKMVHVPYKSDSEVIREVMSGSVQMAIMTSLSTVPFIKSGKIKALAVTTAHRLPYLPDTPSLTEIGVKGLTVMEPYTFISFVGPVGMPPAIVAQLNEAMNKVSSMPDVAALVRNTLYSEPTITTPVTFRDFIEKDLAKWRELGKTLKLTE
jgi:tripartite-type tricarboxylate transporter receptor subunit TctC